jgi:hypothetical protein
MTLQTFAELPLSASRRPVTKTQRRAYLPMGLVRLIVMVAGPNHRLIFGEPAQSTQTSKAPTDAQA